ncbi:MAG: hypothetical protein H0V12_04560 [Chloroflexi bacterium]|nr:hypothetical protein [Chloroflexota bacterium]
MNASSINHGSPDGDTAFDPFELEVAPGSNDRYVLYYSWPEDPAPEGSVHVPEPGAPDTAVLRAEDDV